MSLVSTRRLCVGSSSVRPTKQPGKLCQDYDVEIYKNLYQPLTPSMPFRPDDAVQSVLDSGLFSAGHT